MSDHRTLRGVAPRTAWPALALGAVLALTATGCTSAGDDPPPVDTRAAGADEGEGGPAGSGADEEPAAPEPDEELTTERPADGDADGGGEPSDDGPAGDAPADDPGGDDGSGGDSPGDDEEVSPPAPLPLTGTEWHVVSVTTGGETVRADSTVVGRLVLDDDGGLGVRACNSISGTARQLGGGRLDLETGLGTLRMCTGLQQRLENGVVAFLDGTADYAVTGDRLVLTKANGDRMELRGTR